MNCGYARPLPVNDPSRKRKGQNSTGRYPYLEIKQSESSRARPGKGRRGSMEKEQSNDQHWYMEYNTTFI